MDHFNQLGTCFLKLFSLLFGCFKYFDWYLTSDGAGWTEDEFTGIFLTSEDRIQQHITVPKPLRPVPSAEELKKSSSSTSRLKIGPSTSPVREQSLARLSDFLSFNYTRVPANDFHKRSGLPDPNERFNSTLENHFEADITEFHIPPKQHQYQYISEFDIKLRPVDIVIPVDGFNPFMNVLKEWSSMNSGVDPCEENDIASHPLRIPSLNNNSLPLIYLESGRIRVFVRTEEFGLLPNTAVIQVNSALICSQVLI